MWLLKFTGIALAVCFWIVVMVVIAASFKVANQESHEAGQAAATHAASAP